MNEQLLEKIVNCPRLPSLPAAALEVLDLCRRDDVAISEIARTISRDPALTAKILKTVNSGYYSLNNRVSSVSHAMVLLGINTVKTLALGFTLVNNLRELSTDFDPLVIWRRSLYAAVGARTVAHKMGGIDEEEAFLGGLLEDLGILALLQALGAPYVKLLQASGDGLGNLAQLEQQMLSLDHAVVGMALAEKWQLPTQLLEPIRYHENPEEYPGGTPPRMVTAVALGSLAAQPFMHPAGNAEARGEIDTYLRSARDWANLEEKVASELLQSVGEKAPTMIRHFDLPDGPSIDPQEIVAQAQEAMMELTLQTQMQAQAAMEQAEEFKVKATRDSLTGARNRGEFDKHLARAFEQSEGDERAFSLAIADLDRFKLVNDTHGHQAGDQVLRHVADILQKAEEEGAIVARYGGEEFGLILEGKASKSALSIIEKLRAAIEQSPVELQDGTTIRVTASFGVSTHNETMRFKEPAAMLAIADRALYGAKEAGRNTVRILTSDTGFLSGDSAKEDAA